MRFDLTGVEDSARYLIYRYRIANPLSRRGGVASVGVDLSAPPGTGRVTLPFTGQGGIGGGGPADHVPVGGIGPEGWKMQVLYNAGFDWYAADVGVVVNDSGLPASADSAAPGSSKEGFALRSPYMSGIRRFMAEPTYQSCCSKPIPNTEENEYPNPSDFRVRGFTVAPTVRPEDMSLDILAADLQEVCGPLHWLTDPSACQTLRTDLDQARGAFRRHDQAAMVTALGSFLDVLENLRRAGGGVVNENAYWLLKVNGEYLRSH